MTRITAVSYTHLDVYKRQEDGLDGPDDSAGGGDSQTPQPDPADGDGGGDGGGDEADGVVVIPPVDPPQGPCVGHDPAQGHLRVTPDPLVLASNVKTGEITIRNCGGAAVHWSATVNPKVRLASAGGDLAAGASSAPVSYTHLDVYKRQQRAQRDW